MCCSRLIVLITLIIIFFLPGWPVRRGGTAVCWWITKKLHHQENRTGKKKKKHIYTHAIFLFRTSTQRVSVKFIHFGVVPMNYKQIINLQCSSSVRIVAHFSESRCQSTWLAVIHEHSNGGIIDWWAILILLFLDWTNRSLSLFPDSLQSQWMYPQL